MPAVSFLQVDEDTCIETGLYEVARVSKNGLDLNYVTSLVDAIGRVNLVCDQVPRKL